jgi:hypothetical protein
MILLCTWWLRAVEVLRVTAAAVWPGAVPENALHAATNTNIRMLVVCAVHVRNVQAGLGDAPEQETVCRADLGESASCGSVKK